MMRQNTTPTDTRTGLLMLLAGLLVLFPFPLLANTPRKTPPTQKTTPAARPTPQTTKKTTARPTPRTPTRSRPVRPTPRKGLWNGLSRAMGRLMPSSVRKSWTKTQKKWHQTIIVYNAIKKLLSEEEKERRLRLKKEKKAALKARWKSQDSTIESTVQAEFRLTFYQRACIRGSARSCLEWMKMEPQKVDPKHFLRGILLKRKRWKQVLPLCKMLTSRKTVHFEDRLCLAESLAALGKHLKAQQKYDAILRSHPNHGPTWLALGELEWKREQFLKAERACRKATVLLPSSSQSWECLAKAIQSQKKRKKEALRAFHKSCTLGSSTACKAVLELRPKGVRGWWWWGATVARMGSRGVSIETVRRSCQLGVSSACISLSNEMMKKARNLVKHQQPARANGWYQRATTVAPQHAPAWREKGLFLFAQKQWPASCVALATSLRLNQKQPTLWKTLSVCYKMMARQTLQQSQNAMKQACALGVHDACKQLKK